MVYFSDGPPSPPLCDATPVLTRPFLVDERRFSPEHPHAPTLWPLHLLQFHQSNTIQSPDPTFMSANPTAYPPPPSPPTAIKCLIRFLASPCLFSPGDMTLAESSVHPRVGPDGGQGPTTAVGSAPTARSMVRPSSPMARFKMLGTWIEIRCGSRCRGVMVSCALATHSLLDDSIRFCAPSF